MFHWPFELPVLHLFRFFVFYYCISPTPCHPSFLLRNLYASQEATLRTFHGTTDQFKTGKGVHQGYILSPCLFNFYAEYVLQQAELDELQAGMKTAGRNINNLRYADVPLLWQKAKRN